VLYAGDSQYPSDVEKHAVVIGVEVPGLRTLTPPQILLGDKTVVAVPTVTSTSRYWIRPVDNIEAA